MRKGEKTREYILRKAAVLFNHRGYYGTSMSDIMAATGMEKGGIYNHFKSKDDLAMQAYQYATDLIRQDFAEAIRGKYDAVERLQAVVSVFAKMHMTPLPGGCPVVNTSVQAGGAHLKLKTAVKETMQEWRDFIIRIVESGQRREQIRLDVDPDAVATLLISSIEGAIILANIYQDNCHLERVVAHLNQHFTQLAC